MKINRQLSGAQKQTENQLKIKDDKLKQALKAKDVALDELKVKEKESKEFLERQTFEELRSDRTQFTSSVSRLETDLNESIQQHNRFLD